MKHKSFLTFYKFSVTDNKMENINTLAEKKYDITSLANYFKTMYGLRDNLKSLTNLVIKTLHSTTINGYSLFNLCRKNGTCELTVNQFIAQCFPKWKQLIAEKYPETNLTKDEFTYAMLTNPKFDAKAYNDDSVTKKILVNKPYLTNAEKIELLSLQIKLCDINNYIK